MSEAVGEALAAPRVRGGWPAVGAVTLGAFALITMEFLPIGLLPEIADSLGISEGTAGLTVTAPGLAAALAAPAVVVRLASWDRRRVLLGLALLLVVSAAVGASAQGLAQMLVARVLLGVGIGGFWAIGPGIGMRLVDPLGPDGRAPGSSRESPSGPWSACPQAPRWDTWSAGEHPSDWPEGWA